MTQRDNTDALLRSTVPRRQKRKKNREALTPETTKAAPQHRGAAFFAHIETPNHFTPMCVGKTQLVKGGAGAR